MVRTVHAWDFTANLNDAGPRAVGYAALQYISKRGDGMDASYVYGLLQEACLLLERAGNTAVAAHVSHCMAMVNAEYGVGRDHLDPRE